MVYENNVPIENKKPVELVQEIDDKYEIPSLEEFMKTYKVDQRMISSYENEGNAEWEKGYGPCSGCYNNNTFKLKILLKNCIWGSKGMTVYNVKSARNQANEVIAETGNWEDNFWTGCFSREDRQKLANRIDSEINWHEKGHDVDTEVCNKDEGTRKSETSGLTAKQLEDYYEIHNYCMYGPGSYAGGERGGRGTSSDFLD